MNKYGVDIKWLAVTCFEMKFNNLTVVSDPYITECIGTNLDYNAYSRRVDTFISGLNGIK